MTLEFLSGERREWEMRSQREARLDRSSLWTEVGFCANHQLVETSSG